MGVPFTQAITVTAAALGNVVVSGTKGAAVSGAETTITLTNAGFHALGANASVTSWFSNLPAGITAKTKEAVAANATSATVVFSGTPTAARTAPMQVTVGAAANTSGAAIAAAMNENARWAITDGVPKTGDKATPLLWLGICLAAGVGLAAIATLRRKVRRA